MREKVKVDVYQYGCWETEELFLMTKDELAKHYHPRVIVKQRPRGISTFSDTEYVEFHGKAVLVKDFKEVLANCPHYPNKKESKALRKAKIKQGK
jgi:hypothetical protein